MRVNVWIRQECQEAWNQIDNKSEWISDMLLNGVSSNGRTEAFEASNPGSSPGSPANLIQTKDDAWFTAGLHKDNATFLVPGCCLDKKNKCKHWEWDGLGSKYINKNTKDEIEVI